MNIIDSAKNWWNSAPQGQSKDQAQIDKAQLIANIIMPVLAGVEGATNKSTPYQGNVMNALNQTNQNFSAIKQNRISQEENLRKKALEEKLQSQKDTEFGTSQELTKMQLAKLKADEIETENKKSRSQMLRDAMSEASKLPTEEERKSAMIAAVVSYGDPSDITDLVKSTAKPTLSFEDQFGLWKAKTDYTDKQKDEDKQVKLDEEAQARKERVQEVRDLVEEIKNHPGYGVGMSIKRMNILPTSPESDFKRKVDRLKSLIQLDNRKLLKGSGGVSDAENEMLRKASTALDINQDDASFRKELDRIQSAVMRKNAPAGSSGKGKDPLGVR